TDEMLERARERIPELPMGRIARYEALGLSAESAHLLAFRPAYGSFFERVLDADGALDPQATANWVGAELARRLDDEDPAASKVTPEALAQLVAMVGEKQVTAAAARTVLDKLVERGGSPAEIVEAEGLAAMGDGDQLSAIVQAAIEANPDAVEAIKAGR